MTLPSFHGIFSGFGQSSERVAGEPVSGGGALPTPARAQKAVGQIAVDIYEQDGYYIIRAPIAGIKLSDLDIEVDGNVITIRGARAQSEDVASDQYYLRECYWGEFSRSVTLPTAVDAKKVKATFSKDSILKILIPKEDRVKIVRINEG